MSEINEIVSKAAIEDIIRLNESFIKLDSNMSKILNNSKSLTDQLNKTAQSTANTEQKAKEYNVILDQTAANQKELVNQQKQLETSQAKLNAIQSETNQELLKLKRQISEENELLKLNTIMTDKNSGSLEKAAAYNRVLEKEKKKLDLTTKEGIARLKEINIQQDKNNELLAAGANKLQAQKINIGNYKSALSDLKMNFLSGNVSAGELAKGIANVGKQMIITFITNPILLAIGAIVGALAGLVAIFKSTDAGANALQGTFTGLKDVIDIIIDRIGALIRLDFKRAFGGLGKQIEETAKAGYDYVQVLDDIEDREAASSQRRAKLEKEIADLINKSKDVRLSYQDQIKYAEEALKKQEELNGIELGFIKERNEADLDRLARKMNIAGMDINQKKEQLRVWLQTDDLELNSLAEKDAEFKRFVDDNEKAFQDLQKAKATETDKERELLEGNRRLRTKMYSDFKRLDTEAAAEAKRAADEKAKQAKALADQQREAGEMAQKGAEMEQKRNADIRKDTQELNDFLEAESQNYIEVKENETALIDAMIENSKKQSEIKYRQQVLLIKSTSKTEEEAAKRIAALDESNIQGTISNISRQLEASDISAERRLELETQLAEAQMNLDDAVFERKKSNEEKAAELRKAAFEGTMQVANALFDFMGSRYNDELTLLEQKNQQGLLSDKEYAKQKAEIEIKQAKLAKIQGVFETSINTAAAVVGMLKDPGGVAGTIMAVAAGITGGLQIASILSQPLPTIPAFLHGGVMDKGYGTVAEDGRPELGITKTGEAIIFDKPQFVSGSKFKGMHIKSNPELEAMKAMNQFNYVSDNTALRDEIKLLRQDIQNKPVFIFDKEHNIVGKRIGNYTEKYVNRLKFGE